MDGRCRRAASIRRTPEGAVSPAASVAVARTRRSGATSATSGSASSRSTCAGVQLRREALDRAAVAQVAGEAVPPLALARSRPPGRRPRSRTGRCSGRGWRRAARWAGGCWAREADEDASSARESRGRASASPVSYRHRSVPARDQHAARARPCSPRRGRAGGRPRAAPRAARRSAASKSGSHRTRPAAPGVGGGLGDQPPGHAGEVLRPLARRIDVEHAGDVGGGQRRAELPRKVLGAREQVRLEDRDDPAPRPSRPLARRRDRRRDLGRVVGVVVDDMRARSVSPELLEPPPRAAEGRQRRRPPPPGPAPASTAASSAAAALRRLCSPGTARSGPVPRPNGRRARRRGARARGPVGSTACGAPARNCRNASSSSRREDHSVWWSSSTFVTTATSTSRARKLRSDSSASTTSQSPLPHAAFVPVVDSVPPMTYAGSRPQPSSAWATIEDVVVFPWAPATAIVRFSRVSSASRSARDRTRSPRSRAAATSGLVGRDRGRDDDLDVGALGHVRRVVPDRDLDPRRAHGLQVRRLGRGPSR